MKRTEKRRKNVYLASVGYYKLYMSIKLFSHCNQILAYTSLTSMTWNSLHIIKFPGRWGRGTGSQNVVRYLREIFTLGRKWTRESGSGSTNPGWGSMPWNPFYVNMILRAFYPPLLVFALVGSNRAYSACLLGLISSLLSLLVTKRPYWCLKCEKCNLKT